VAARSRRRCGRANRGRHRGLDPRGDGHARRRRPFAPAEAERAARALGRARAAQCRAFPTPTSRNDEPFPRQGDRAGAPPTRPGGVVISFLPRGPPPRSPALRRSWDATRATLAGLAKYGAPRGGRRHTAPSRSCTRSRTGKTRSSRRSSWTSQTASMPRWRRSTATPSQFDGAKAAGENPSHGAGSLRADPDPVGALWLADPLGLRGAVLFCHETLAVDDVLPAWPCQSPLASRFFSPCPKRLGLPSTTRPTHAGAPRRCSRRCCPIWGRDAFGKPLLAPSLRARRARGRRRGGEAQHRRSARGRSRGR